MTVSFTHPATSLLQSLRWEMPAWMVFPGFPVTPWNGGTEPERRPAITGGQKLPATVIDPDASIRFFFQSFDMPEGPEHDLQLPPQATKHDLTSRDRRSRPHASKWRTTSPENFSLRPLGQEGVNTSSSKKRKEKKRKKAGRQEGIESCRLQTLVCQR